MSKKLLLILLVVCIIGGFFIFENFMNRRIEYLEKREEEKNNNKTKPQAPLKKFNDLEITYYGDGNEYQMNADFDNLVQEAGNDIDFKGLDSIITGQEGFSRQLTSPHGTLINKKGILELKGPVNLKEASYLLAMDNLDINLNQGEFVSQGDILVTGPGIKVTAGKMESDFDLNKVHFSGRPRLIIKEGDIK